MHKIGEKVMNSANENKKDSVTRLHIYGDSILRGVVMDPQSGKYVTLPHDDFTAFSEKADVDVVNKSKFGYTVERGITLISRAIMGKTEKPCDVMIVEYGGNDCNFNWREVSNTPDEEHLPSTPLPRFREALGGLVSTLKRLQIRPVLVTLPPIDADRYIDYIVKETPGTDKNRILSWLGDTQMIYRYQELYSSVITKLAYETGTLYVDLRTAFLDKHNYRDLLCADGIHPNASGHALIGDAFRCAREKILAPCV